MFDIHGIEIPYIISWNGGLEFNLIRSAYGCCRVCIA